MRIESDNIQLIVDDQPFHGLRSFSFETPLVGSIAPQINVAATVLPIPLGVTEGTYKAEGSLTITKEGWEHLFSMLPHWDWRYGGGNARDRRKRRRIAGG